MFIILRKHYFYVQLLNKYVKLILIGLLIVTIQFRHRNRTAHRDATPLAHYNGDHQAE